VSESRVAEAVAWRQFENPEMGLSAVGSRYQRTGEGRGVWEDSVCTVGTVDCMNWRQCQSKV
jgi:hypothetical protein